MQRALTIVVAILVMSGSAFGAPDTLIRSVRLSSTGPVYFGQPLDITVRGAPGGQAWWFLGNRSGSMSERAPGVYVGRYRVRQGVQGQARLRVVLFTPDGRTASRDLGMMVLNGTYALTPVEPTDTNPAAETAGDRATPPRPADGAGSRYRAARTAPSGLPDAALARAYVPPLPDQVMAQLSPAAGAAIPYGYASWPDQPSWLAQPFAPTYSVLPPSFYGDAEGPYTPPYYGYGLPYGVPTYPSPSEPVLYPVDPLGMGYLMSAPPPQLALTPAGLFAATPSGWSLGVAQGRISLSYTPRAVFLAPALPVPVVAAYPAPYAAPAYDTYIVPAPLPAIQPVAYAPTTVYRAATRPPYGNAWGYWAKRGQGVALTSAWSGVPRLEVETHRAAPFGRTEIAPAHPTEHVHRPRPPQQAHHAAPRPAPPQQAYHTQAPRHTAPPRPPYHAQAPAYHAQAPRHTAPPRPAYHAQAPRSTAPPRPAYHAQAPPSTAPPRPAYHAQAPRSTAPPRPAYHAQAPRSTAPPRPAYHAQAPRHTAPPRPAYHAERPRNAAPPRHAEPARDTAAPRQAYHAQAPAPHIGGGGPHEGHHGRH